MGKTKKLSGSALFTHNLKETSGGKSMAEGVKHLTDEARKDGFKNGLVYAMTKLSLWERITGRPHRRK